MNRDELDGRKMRKAITRKAVDFTSSVARALETLPETNGDHRLYAALQPHGAALPSPLHPLPC